jgi:RNA polymerase sigma-70 factor (ECF subfamily)
LLEKAGMSVAHSIPVFVEDGPDSDPPPRGREGARAAVAFPVAHEGRVSVLEPLRFDERQFMWLLVSSLRDLRGYARRLTGKTAEAGDLVQEACRRAIESRGRFTPGSDMRSWLCCILRNLHRDRLRRSAREILVDDYDGQFAMPPPEPRPTWSVVSDDDLALALDSLQPQYRRAYVLHAIDGHSYGEIAATLRVPSSTVGTRILRARLLLRAFLLKRLASQTEFAHRG